MCGIIGGNRKDWHYKEALEKIYHRGPDAQRICPLDNFTLAFARLSIIDLSENAMQPMLTDDKKIGIVFNGEIYNFVSVREELLEKGYSFKSKSDTEVVLRAYQEYGDSFIHKIDGMFAIAIYDYKRKQIRLYRDRIGIKPLYYFYDGKDFAFASELKGITTLCNDKEFSFDTTALYDFLFYQYIPDPKSMYTTVKKLEPASYLVYDIACEKIIKQDKYWRLIPSGREAGGVNAVECQQKLKELISSAVREQMVSDVPIGTFLSGGVDSSIVSYECSTLSNSISAFCTGFAEKTFDESPYAQKVADAIGIDLKINRMDINEAHKIYSFLGQWFDEPFGDSTAYANYLVAKEIKKHVTVALSGDGGDEVFGGYSRYSLYAELNDRSVVDKAYGRLYKFCGWENYIPNGIKNRCDDEVERYAYLSGFDFEPHVKLNLSRVKETLKIPKDYDVLWHFRKFYHKDLPRITRVQYIDMNSYLPSGMLPKVDRTSMAVSLEVRVPLLDTKVVEYAFSLPQDVRCTSTDLKKILKETYLHNIPKECMYRRKQGFSVPSSYYEKAGLRFKERVLLDLWGVKV